MKFQLHELSSPWYNGVESHFFLLFNSIVAHDQFQQCVDCSLLQFIIHIFFQDDTDILLIVESNCLTPSLRRVRDTIDCVIGWCNCGESTVRSSECATGHSLKSGDEGKSKERSQPLLTDCAVVSTNRLRLSVKGNCTWNTVAVTVMLWMRQTWLLYVHRWKTFESQLWGDHSIE